MDKPIYFFQVTKLLMCFNTCKTTTTMDFADFKELIGASILGVVGIYVISQVALILK